MKDRLTSFERRIEILMFLIKEKHTTVSKIAAMISVSWRTAYSDVVFLSRYAPIYTKTGGQGGVFILEEYNNILYLYLTKDEKELLLSSKEILSTDKQKILDRILYKYSKP